MKIALVYNDDFSLWVFRRGLLSELIKKGHLVYLVCPTGKYMKSLCKMGAVHIPVSIDRFFNPTKDIFLFLALFGIFWKEKFDLVHTFTIKPNIYGVLSARLAGIKNIVMSVTGVGVLKKDKYSDNVKMKLVRFTGKGLYRISCRMCRKISFQNDDDVIFFKKMRIISRGKEIVLERSGVDLSWFSPRAIDIEKLCGVQREIGCEGTYKIVTMVTRPLWNKGVIEFIEASEILAEKIPFIKFVLVGGVEEGNHLSIPAEFIRSRESNNFTWMGFRDDIREIQAISDISVLPACFREGIPRNLLEAMAMGNPIVTTDNVGCKEVVENGKNGFLVPVSDSKALASAIEELIINENKRIKFGKYSRKKAESEFDDKFVVEKIITQLYQFK